MADKYEPGQEFRSWTQVPSLTANQGGILPLVGMLLSAMQNKNAAPDGAMPPPGAVGPGMVPPTGGMPPTVGQPPAVSSAPSTPAYSDPNAYMQGNQGVLKIISSLFGMGQ